LTFVDILVIFSYIMPEGISSVSGRAIFGKNEITRPAAPSPAPAAIPEKYSKEEREIINLLDVQIGKRLSKKAGESEGNTDQALQSIINENGQSVKNTLSNRYKDTPEVLRTAINKKLNRLQDTGNPSAHTPLSKSAYIDFLNKFLSELKEQSRRVGIALSLPNIKKSN
jgi:hypothetical protein